MDKDIAAIEAFVLAMNDPDVDDARRKAAVMYLVSRYLGVSAASRLGEHRVWDRAKPYDLSSQRRPGPSTYISNR